VPATGVPGGGAAPPFQAPLEPLSSAHVEPAHQFPFVAAMNAQYGSAWAWLTMTTVLKEAPGSVVGSAPEMLKDGLFAGVIV